MTRVSRGALAALTLAAAASIGCGSSAESSPPAPAAPAPVDTSSEAPGPHPVGHSRLVVSYGSPARALTVTIWYPADAVAAPAAATGIALEDFVGPGADHDALVGLVAAAPEKCTTRRASSALDAPPAAGNFPLVAFSHCHGCVGFEAFTMAQRLASFGIAVIAPDHTGNTLFDELAGKNAALGTDFLITRAADIGAVLDAALDPGAASIPAMLRGRFDPAAVGVAGHSFGGLTTALVAQNDPRPKAALIIAAPAETFAPTVLSKISKPLFFLLAREDHSINEYGNGLIRTNAARAPGPTVLAEVADAGHWSFSDICGLTKSLAAGCGGGTRQAPKDLAAPFTYLDNDAARAIAAAYVTAYFRARLMNDTKAATYLRSERPSGGVTVTSKP